MSETKAFIYTKQCFEKEDVFFLNRIELSSVDVLRFLHAVLPHKLGNSYVLYDTGLPSFGFKIASKRGKFVKIRAILQSHIHTDFIGRKGFVFKVKMYMILPEAKMKFCGHYRIFYQPYSLEYFIFRKGCFKCSSLRKFFQFGDKPVVKYVFKAGNERIKRYFKVGRRAIRAYKELILSPMAEDSL